MFESAINVNSFLLVGSPVNAGWRGQCERLPEKNDLRHNSVSVDDTDDQDGIRGQVQLRKECSLHEGNKRCANFLVNLYGHLISLAGVLIVSHHFLDPFHKTDSGSYTG